MQAGSDHAQQGDGQQRKPRQRSRRRELFCPAHPEQKLVGNGKKYFLHLLTSEQLKQRGMPDGKARLVIKAFPVLVLSNEWIEELFCAACGARVTGAMWCAWMRCITACAGRGATSGSRWPTWIRSSPTRA